MKRENLYLVGGALLASTALTSAASAATYTLTNTGAVNPVAAATSTTAATATTTARRVSAQAFPANATSATQVGGIGAASATALVVRFTGPLAATFNATISVTNAKFRSGSVTSNDVIPLSFATFTGTGSATLIATISTTMGCAVAFSADNLILGSCNPAVAGLGSIGGFLISSVGFDNAAGLATAGTSIQLGGSITVSGTTLDTTAPQSVLTSTNSLTTTITPTSGIASLNVNSTPAFANFGSATALSTNIATINITQAGAFGLDLASTIVGDRAVGATQSVKVTSTIFSDDALVRTDLISSAGTLTAAPTIFTGGFVTFGAIAAAAIQDTFAVNVVFNGTSQIDAANAGTVELTFSSAGGTAGTANAVAPATATGSTAGLSRAGLNIDINGMQPSVAQGARTYTSLLRIANTGTFAGTVQIVLRNEATGAVLGTYTSPSIPAGGSLQVTSGNVEAGAGVTATASVLYRASVSGNINGYVQHVNWNQDAGFFSDLSGRRQ